MTSQLVTQAILSVLVYMSVWFAFGKALKKLSVVDIAWGGGFILIAWLVAAQHHSARSWLIAVLVTIWGTRIIFHLGNRVLRSKEDERYTELAKKWKGNYWLRAFFSIFMLQGLLVVAVGLPILVAANEQNENLGVLSVFGAALWALGFIIEAVADFQLRQFRKESQKGEVMDQGLWAYSRHPNYFGELMQWWAIAIIALQVMHGWIGLIGPLVLTTLIVFVSGIPPIEKKKQSDPAYADYMRRTSPLILWPPKRDES
jgi:steroid 5-alpha reductase family enzyme